MINDDAQSADALLRANAELRAEVARLQELADYWRIRAQDTLVSLHEAEQERDALRYWRENGEPPF